MGDGAEDTLLGKQRLRILLVEDVPEDAEFLERHLAKAGYNVFIVGASLAPTKWLRR